MKKPQSPLAAPAAYPLRIPASVRARLADEAQKNRRSLNAEIVVRLEQSLPEPVGSK